MNGRKEERLCACVIVSLLKKWCGTLGYLWFREDEIKYLKVSVRVGSPKQPTKQHNLFDVVVLSKKPIWC